MLRVKLAPLLHDFISRCESVRLETHADTIPWPGIFPLVKDALYSAGRLHDMTIGADWAQKGVLCGSVFSRLKTLRVEDVMALYNMRDVFRSPSLQSLDISCTCGIEWDSVLEVLQHCPNLQRLSIAYLELAFARPTPPCVQLLNLHHLIVDVRGNDLSYDSPLEMLQYIHTPKLVSLQVKSDAERGPTMGCALSLAEFLVRTPVVELSLQDAMLAGDELVIILQSAPHIKALHFHVHALLGDGAYPLLSLLSESRSESTTNPHSCYCPALESFTFTVHRKGCGTTGTLSSIMAFLEYRTNVVESDEVKNTYESSGGPAASGDARIGRRPLRHAEFTVGVSSEVESLYADTCGTLARGGLDFSIKFDKVWCFFGLPSRLPSNRIIYAQELCTGSTRDVQRPAWANIESADQ
jgi:hypothetical protein